MKIKLIAPHEQGGISISSAETFKIQKVSLPLLAALTPAGHMVRIVDEAFAPDDVHEDVDLVGISVMTDLALRAYHIADTYRQRGVKVVMGGIHPTVLPYEALKHADSVVVGEGEQVWPKLVSDAESRQMQTIYRASRMEDLRRMPGPRRDLYPRPAYKSYTPLAIGVETARGCPYDCEFCSIGSVMGRQYRPRPLPEVLAEIESIESRHLFFVDDALGLNRASAKRLFTEMIPLRRIWAGQGPVSLAEDLDLLRLMKRSGCLGLLVGFESVQKETQGGMKKISTLKIDFSEALRRFHGEGLAVLGAFVFGFDHENKDVFDQTLEFAMKNRPDCLELRILTPFPGTRLYTRLLREGRLFAPEWWLQGYPPDTVLFQPKGMTVDELLEGFARLNRQVYSLDGVIKRFFGMSPWKRNAVGCSVYFGFNLATRKRYIESLGISQPFAGASGQEIKTVFGGRYECDLSHC
ncbi:MAG: hypothetical protein A2156_14660 [Deltaproteobacteria bacterium RBG_16_48_10]|nr:MAG: hypothetical protein A2156_14660 [Deltaproteobacteria bacterium RBG_16_48_10]